LVIVRGASLPVPEAYAIATNAMLFAGVACTGVYWIGGARNATAEGLVLAGIALLFLFLFQVRRRKPTSCLRFLSLPTGSGKSLTRF